MRLNSYDVCVQGFERLRSQSEFILAIIVSAGIEPREEDDEPCYLFLYIEG